MPETADPRDIDPARFAVHTASPRGFAQAYVREGVGGVPLVCVHGWPESKRVFWRVIEPLADFICAADQPRVALASALRLLLAGVEQTNCVGRRHLESVQAGA